MAGECVGMVYKAVGLRSTPMHCLAKQKGLLVKERVNAIEAITAVLGQEIEMNNKYKIYAPDSDDDKFYAVENTNIILRNLKQCFGDCMPWNLDILYAEGWGALPTPAFKVHRPFSCTCCCINRPAAYMTDDEHNPIGSLHDPWTCCGGLDFTVRDPDGNLILNVDGGCFQPGFWCPLPCGAMKQVKFSIKEHSSGREIGRLVKKVPSAFTFLFAPDVDDYKLEFKEMINPEHKALLMALTIFIDFRYFNDNSNDGSNSTRSAFDSMYEAVEG